VCLQSQQELNSVQILLYPKTKHSFNILLPSLATNRPGDPPTRYQVACVCCARRGDEKSKEMGYSTFILQLPFSAFGFSFFLVMKKKVRNRLKQEDVY
jgi:hypothetical protein